MPSLQGKDKEMDKELQEYYENLLELFASKGWKQFLEDIGDNLEMLGNITTITDGNQFWYRKGQVEAIQRILSYEETIVNSYEDFQREAAWRGFMNLSVQRVTTLRLMWTRNTAQSAAEFVTTQLLV